jgi:hypothetical protein
LRTIVTQENYYATFPVHRGRYRSKRQIDLQSAISDEQYQSLNQNP